MSQAEITDERLQEAWQARRRHDWPPTFDEAMANPVYARLVRLQAEHGYVVVHRPAIEQPLPPDAEFGRIERPSQPRKPRANPPPRRPSTRPLPQPTFDQKRAASGERDED